MKRLLLIGRSETMAAKRNDLIGMVFGNLFVVEFAHIYNGHSYWLCRCECGGYTIARGSHLKIGNISSCGCKKGNITHGESKTKAVFSVAQHERTVPKPESHRVPPLWRTWYLGVC